jgi:hypothetical protein
MTSFIELPRLAFDGREMESAYINTADIISFQEQWDGQVKLEVRGLGNACTSVAVKTYVPLAVLLGELTVLAARPGVSTWSESSRSAWATPIAARLADAAARERAATR